MKIRNMIAKFTCGLLVTTMVFSLVACGEKESDDDDDDKEDKKKVEKTVDELMDDISKNAVISTDMIEKALEDDCFTYEEFEEIMKSTSSCKAEGKVEFDLSMEAEEDGEKTEEELVADISFVMEYDSKNIAFHLGLEMNMETSEEKDSNKLDMWIVNEDDTYYMYQKESSDDVAYRQEIGNLEEAFGDGITKDDIEDLLAEMDGIEDFEEMYNSMLEYAESDTVKDLEKQFSLDDELVEYDGKEYYNLVFNFNADKVIDILKENEDVKKLLEEMEVNDVDEILSTEVMDDVTIQDIVDVVNFDINYYVDTKDYYIAHMELDLKDALNDGLGFFEKYMLKMAEEEEAVDPSINFECNAAKITYDFDNDADVTVKFEGEYEEMADDDWEDDDWSDDDNVVLPDDGWSDDYSESGVVVNGNTFDLYSYSDEKLMTVTIPEGFSVENEYSSSSCVYLEDDNYNEIEVDSDAYYWIIDFLNGEAYEPDLEFYTRDEMEQLDSIETNQGTVYVICNTWSFDEDFENEYYVDYTLVLEVGDEYPCIKVSADTLEEYDLTLESLAKTMLQ